MRQLFLLFIFVLMPFLLGAQTTEISHNVNFDYDKDILTKEAQGSIDSLLKTLDLSLDMYEAHIVGHTDSDGSLKYNLDLSMRRSKTVKKYLLGAGFTESQLALDGKSFLDPVATNSSDKGKAKNRRVEILLIAKRSPLQVPIERWLFTAEEGVTYTYDRSGTVIHIPADALLKADGSAAKGEARLEYREFRDAADFIAFGVTMQHGDGWFNSGGMFEIRVFQGDEELKLPTYKPMELEFKLTDTLPELNFYEYSAVTKKWTELGAISDEPRNEYQTSQTVSIKKEINQDCFVPFAVDSKPIGDTLKTFFDAMQLAAQLAHTPGAFTELYQTGFMDFDHRWKQSSNYKNFQYAATKYVGSTSGLQLISKKEYYGIKLSAQQPKIDVNTKKVTFEIRDLAGDHPEIRALKDRIWSFNTQGVSKGTTRTFMFLSNWSDARLVHKGGMQFELTIKGRDKYTVMDITPVLEGKEKATAAATCEAIIKKYESGLNRHRRALDDSITFARENWGYFLQFAKTLMPANEKCMGLREWVKYFDNNIQTMQIRYDSLWQLPFNSTTLHMLKKAMGDLPISPTLKPVTPVEVPAFVRILSVDGFGVYNCDQIQRLGNSLPLIATYVDEKGEAIDAESLSLVDYSINSVLTFPPNQISYNPGAKTALVLVAKNGNKYILRSTQFAAISLKNKKSYTFQMENVTAQLKSVDSLRGMLSL